MESAIISRLIKEDFMPSCPIAMPSDTAIVVNSLGVLPELFTPSFALEANMPKCILQGVASLHVLQTATKGFERSESVNPIDLYIARCGARDGPSSVFLLSK